MNFIKNCIFCLFTLFTTVVSNDVTVSILVKQHNVDVLEQNLLEISNPYSTRYGDYYTNEEINTMVYM